MGQADTDALILRHVDRLIWGLVAAMTAIVLAAPMVSRFHIDWPAFAAPGATCLALGTAAWFYGNWRIDLRLASAGQCTAQVIAFAAVGAPLSYLAAAAAGNLPLQDQAFDLADKALGLDWRTLLGWLNNAPVAYAALRVTYMSLTLQMTTAVLCLAFTGRLKWLRIYNLAFVLTALVTIAISAVLPAAGVWPYYGLTSADSAHVIPAVSTSWPVFYGLRDGTLRALVAVGSEGIITFPSLHAALAVVLIAALWPLRALRWPTLALNTLMLVATPIDGSHYFVDVFAGVAVAALSFAAAWKIAGWAARNSEAAAATLPVAQIAAGKQSSPR